MEEEQRDIKYRVMVIDDSEFVLEVVSEVLDKHYQVVTCASGMEAILGMDKEVPDLVLLDYEMPNLNGLQIIRWIKSNKSLAHIPVIFITAHADVKFELEAFSLGAVDYVHKPFAPELLLKRVEVHLEHAKRQQRLYDYNLDLQVALEDKTTIIKELQYAIVFTLSDLVEMRDNTTGGHIYRTTAYYKLILEYLEKNNIYQEARKGMDHRLVLEAAQMHDIGKVAIPDAILLKPDKLTIEEFEVMKTHTTIGYSAIIKAMQLTHSKEFLNFAALVALTHHEWWDGTGYPHSLVGEGIPLVGRIMAIVDVYDAMVSERPYKRAMSHEDAMDEIYRSRGDHFDPVLVDVAMKLSNKIKWVAALEEAAIPVMPKI